MSVIRSAYFDKVADHGLRQSLFMKNQKDINQILENIVILNLCGVDAQLR